MMGCRHKKEGRYASDPNFIKWCDDCARKKAGPKPEKEFQVGWYVIMVNDDDMGPGKVIEVRMEVHGQATENPGWVETVKAHCLGGYVSAPASSFERLVVEVKPLCPHCVSLGKDHRGTCFAKKRAG